jgi:P2 family phage contractile tail tube protein
MALVPNQVNNFRLYVDGTLFIGVADITLPNIVNQTDELRGGALGGPIMVPVIGHTEDLTITMTFFAMFPGCSKFLQQSSLNLQANSVVQYLDNTTNAFTKQPWSYMFTSFPKEFNPGRLQQGAKPDMTVARCVTALQIFNNDQRVCYIDKGNLIFEVDGVDYLSQDRAWL